MHKISFPILLSCCFISPSTIAAGLWLYENGSPELGTASAGSNAIANSASIAGYNPAGMTRLNQTELMVGIQPMYVDAKFDVESSTHGSDGGGNAGGFVPAGSLFYVNSYSDDIKFGVAAGSYLGLGLDYGDDWAGRYFVKDGNLLTVAINPSAGYKVNNKLSIGVGVQIVYSKLEQNIAFNNNPLGVGNMPDGNIEIKEDDYSFGFNLGVLYQFTPQTRLGFSYRSQVDIEFTDSVNADGVLPNIPELDYTLNADLEMNLPQTVMSSLYHELDDNWALMANIGWQNWSEFGSSEFKLKRIGQTVSADRKFDDTWHGALGVHYQYSDKWKLMSGIAYDSSPVSQTDRTADMPLDRQVRYSVGAQYQYANDTSVMIGYEYLDAGSAKINQTRNVLAETSLKGEFSSNAIHILAINVSWTY